MSYLVDALRKAERERHSQQVGDLYAVSAGSAHAPAGSRAGPWLWLVAILVACNVALAVYVWRPRANQPPPTPTPTVSMATVPPPAVKNPKSSAATTARAAGQSSTGAANSGQLASRDRRDADPKAPAMSRGPGTSASPAQRRDATAEHGTVRYSKQSLTNDNGSATRAGSAAGRQGLPDQNSLGGVPAVIVNGQLYSTIPGRSFILVGGRRYHEGERLAAGPAVESIGPNGATLLYRGRRYHVSGPS